jgi:hypothetical protein
MVRILNYVFEHFFLTKPKFTAYLALLFMVSQIFSAQYVFSIRSMFILVEVTIGSELLPDEYLQC